MIPKTPIIKSSDVQPPPPHGTQTYTLRESKDSNGNPGKPLPCTALSQHLLYLYLSCTVHLGF